MKTPLIFLTLLLGTCLSNADAQAPDGLVFVQGGAFKNPKSQYFGQVVEIPSFYIGKHEVTQKDWLEIMDFNPSVFKGDQLPVQMVNWYECIEYCNKLSEKQKLTPYYIIDQSAKDPLNKNAGDPMKWKISVRGNANGYRLATSIEWEYAASGAHASKGHLYSGGDEMEKLGWYFGNSGKEPLSDWIRSALESNQCQPKPVGGKMPNELGIYDMSGNVREFCWDWFAHQLTAEDDPAPPEVLSMRTCRGGGWIGIASSCTINSVFGHPPFLRAPDLGLRICRNADHGQTPLSK